MFIDVHTHAFHPKIAEKVLQQLGQHYGIQGVGSGLIEDLLARARKAGIDRVVVHSAATAAAQVIPANNFALALKEAHPSVIPFGTIHPDYEDWACQLDRLKKSGIRGLKLHPEFQSFRLDDPRLHPIIEEAQDHFMFMLHIGDVLPPEQNPSCPYKLAALMDLFPRARFIAAHMGGYRHWKYALESTIGRDVYIDTSSSLEFIDDATLAAIWKKHPRERILFGSDYPLYDPADEMARLRKRLKLSDAELEQILRNSAIALGIDQ
jgi:predicted TIM-barrel fold metal-dependent hydrolase